MVNWLKARNQDVKTPQRGHIGWCFIRQGTSGRRKRSNRGMLGSWLLNRNELNLVTVQRLSVQRRSLYDGLLVRRTASTLSEATDWKSVVPVRFVGSDGLEVRRTSASCGKRRTGSPSYYVRFVGSDGLEVRRTMCEFCGRRRTRSPAYHVRFVGGDVQSA